MKSIVAVTMSEAAGIGPEILLRAFRNGIIHEYCRPIAIGDKKVLEAVSSQLKIPMEYNVIEDVSRAEFRPGVMDLFDLDKIPLDRLKPGKPDAITGRAMLDYTRFAVQLFLDGKADGLVGGPHSKKAAEEAGEYFDGYPGLIAKITGSKYPFLMLCAGDRLRVTNVTLHISLRKALEIFTQDLVLNAIRETHRATKTFGIEKPRIAVAGLNPHAGEERMFGDEDVDIILPAVEKAVAEGIDAKGPFPADSLFYGCMDNGKYDAYVAMYHDQAHLPVKVLAFKSSSAVAIGIPVNWATVDHGCALDIAWQGIADPAVLEETIVLISKRAPTFRQNIATV